MPVPARSTARRAIAALALAASAGGVGIASTQAADAAPGAPAAASAAVQPRTAVPWSRVGTGWVAGSMERGGATHLVLASPAGQVYEIATLATGEFVDAIAHDGKHVVTYRTHDYENGRPRVWDMTTGKATALPTNMGSMTFTRPNGTAVMGFNEVGSYGRYGVDGREQLVRPVAMGADAAHLTPNPDGLTQAVTRYAGEGPRVSLYANSTFTKKRTFALPAGAYGCTAMGWNSTTTLVESCTMKRLGEWQLNQVYAQNINGSAPTQLTTGTPPGDGWGVGFDDVITTSIGRLALAQDGTVRPLTGTKAGAKLRLPAINADGSGADVRGIVGDKVLFVSSGMGGSTSKDTVAQYDLRTKAVTYLLGNNSAYPGVLTGEAVIDPRS